MPGMKVTLGAAMRARDVSRPQPRHEAAARTAAARWSEAPSSDAAHRDRVPSDTAHRDWVPSDAAQQDGARRDPAEAGLAAPRRTLASASPESPPTLDEAATSIPGTAGPDVSGTGDLANAGAMGTRGTGRKRHRSRRRFTR
jgi:hypothetical protein